MKEIILNVGFGAGKFSVANRLTADYLRRNQQAFGLHYIATTESQKPGVRAAVAEALGPRFRLAKKGEYIAAWDRGIFHRDRRLVRMWHLTDIAGLVAWRQMRCAVFPLVFNDLDLRFRGLDFHAPSNVQHGDDWNWDAPRQVKASRTGHHVLGNRIYRADRRNPDLLQIVTGDENLDLFRDRWRHWVSSEEHAKSAWEGHLPNSGDHHGGRLIGNIAYAAGSKIRVEVLDTGVSHLSRPDEMDHALDWASLRITSLVG